MKRTLEVGVVAVGLVGVVPAGVAQTLTDATNAVTNLGGITTLATGTMSPAMFGILGTFLVVGVVTAYLRPGLS